MAEHNVPNLDAMPRSELLEFWSHYRYPNGYNGKRAEFLTGLSDAVAAVRVMDTLAAYAMARACMMRLQAEGKIPEAKSYEKHCDIYYSELPEQFRW
jgi:hypothetical protein